MNKLFKSLIILFGIVFSIACIVIFPKLAIYFALIAIVLVVVAMFTIKKPWFGLFLVAFFLPFERIGSFDMGGATVRISQLLAISVIAIWIINGLIKGKIEVKKYPIFWPLVLFFGMCSFSLMNAINVSRGLVVLVFTIFVATVSFIVPQIIDTKEKYKKIIFAIILSSAVVGIFGLFQFAGDVVGLPTSITGLREHYTSSVFGFPRVHSTALEPLYFANFLLIPIALVFTLYVGRRHAKIEEKNQYKIEKFFVKRSVQILLFLLLVFNLMLTLSRGGYLGLIVSAITLAILGAKYFLKPRYIGLVVLVLVLGLASLQYVIGSTGNASWSKFINHAFNFKDGASVEERLDTYEIAEDAFRSSPYLGIGIGNFGPYANLDPMHEPKDGWLIVNNETLELLAEVGVFGFVSFVLIVFIIIFRSVIAIIKTSDIYMKFTLIALLSAFIGILAQYQTFSTLYIMHVWFLIGLLIAGQNIVLNPNNKIK